MRSLLRPSTLPGTDLTAWLLPQMSPFRLETPLTHVHCPVLLSLALWQVAPATHTWSSRQNSPCAISVQRNERCLSINNMLKIGSFYTLQPPTGPLQGATLCTLYQQKQDDSNLKDKNQIFIAIYTTIKKLKICHHAKIDTDHSHSVSKFKC